MADDVGPRDGNMRAIALLALTTWALGCGGTPVEYDLSCQSVRCDNADDTSNFQSGNSRAFTCTWDCADYNGDDRVYVSLTFWSWDGGCWQLETAYVSSGICG